MTGSTAILGRTSYILVPRHLRAVIPEEQFTRCPVLMQEYVEWCSGRMGSAFSLSLGRGLRLAGLSRSRHKEDLIGGGGGPLRTGLVRLGVGEFGVRSELRREHMFQKVGGFDGGNVDAVAQRTRSIRWTTAAPVAATDIAQAAHMVPGAYESQPTYTDALCFNCAWAVGSGCSSSSGSSSRSEG